MAQQASPRDRGSVWPMILILITDDAGMRRINQAVFSSSRVTDVISLRYDPIPGDPPGQGVEIILNADCAIREGSRRISSPSRELALYVAHAFDHLAGQDDNTPSARARMRRRELTWLATAGKLGLIHGLADIPVQNQAPDKRLAARKVSRVPRPVDIRGRI